VAPIKLQRPIPAHRTASNGNSNSTVANATAAVFGSRRAIGRHNRHPLCTAAAATAQHNSKSKEGTSKASSMHNKPAEPHK